MIALLVSSLEHMVADDPEFIAVGFELFTLAQRNAEIAAEYAELQAGMRAHISGVLAAKHEQGILHLAASPDAVVDVLLSLADGLSRACCSSPSATTARRSPPAWPRSGRSSRS